jgi:pimeloyl-ACP methyl ester carboxylesterase
VGHSEGTVTASEISFDHKEDQKISSIILIGVLAENLKDSLQHQLTDVMANNSFAAADINHDGRIYPQEVPEHLKAGLPFDKLDTQKHGYISYGDLMAVLTSQANQFMKAVQLAPADTTIMGKPAQWYRDLFNRKTLLERANEYSYPVLIAHGELDTNVFYKTNAAPLYQKLQTLKKEAVLKSFPLYGHGLSPLKEGQPTLGPIQQDALDILTSWAIAH